ncbi:MAG: tRNA lysidine(34) synthetase TilS, partial [Alkalibacterium sp.]
RYRFFEEIAEKVTSSFILTAHHRDDQVETVLMRLVRGSSLKELTGISTKRRTGEQEVLRLLLPYSKDEITNYAKTHKIPWKEDSSNLSSLYTRNRYRHDIIPRLKKENPAVEQHICDFSNDLNDLLDAVEPLIKEEHDRSFTFSDERIELDLSTFMTKDRGFQKIVLSSAFERWRPQAPFAVSRSHIHQLIDWFQRGGPNTHLELPSRLSARKAYNKCIIEESNSNEPVEDAADSRELPLDQWLTLSETERVGCFTPEVFQKMKDENGAVIYLGDDGATWPLSVRHRRPGDRIKVKGLNGTKKIKDIFIDQKVPKDKRRKAWVVTDKIGRIVWLIGYKESTLSLNPLTDTIIYVLVYQNAATTKR